jgi:6-phosphogluconate dehydrogenase (decarboxylating)
MGEKLGMIGLGKTGLALGRAMMADGHELFGWGKDDATRVIEVYEGKNRK